MQAVADLELPALDYMDPDLTGPRFHQVLRDLREESWVARAEPAGYAVLDREAVTFFLRTQSATFPGERVHEALGVTDGPLHERIQKNLLGLNGEDHRRQRKLVQPAFTPPAADRHRPAMREFLEQLWEPVAGAGRCDFAEVFAAQLPSLVIARLMGAPLEDAPRMAVWANLIQSQFDPVKIMSRREEIERAAVEFGAYSYELLKARQKTPSDDLISQLIAAEEEGDRLSEEECVSLVTAVLVGGVDTTQAQLAQGMRLFAEHPDQWRLLAEDPSLAPAAAEEVLRHEPITPFTARIALEDIEFRDVLFPEGTIVIAASAAANRDPAGWEDADDFDITADRGRAKPLTFGAGPHFCLGANLARAELQEAFTFLAPRMPGLALDGEPEFDTPFGIYGMKSLPVRWDA
ncbi:MAG TPA: cytochrome P450 [Thermoleophilaceae bacterium]|nr:cytochrome P450 [Thermoleophilaceae bacterium]